MYILCFPFINFLALLGVHLGWGSQLWEQILYLKNLMTKQVKNVIFKFSSLIWLKKTWRSNKIAGLRGVMFLMQN